MHTPGPQVSLHRACVDQFVHDPNCAGQLLVAWHPATAAAASRIASGSLLSAARSIASVGTITWRSTNSVASSVLAATGLAAMRSGSVCSVGVWRGAVVQAHALQAKATMTIRVVMLI
jgi:hypothetical protein